MKIDYNYRRKVDHKTVKMIRKRKKLNQLTEAEKLLYHCKCGMEARLFCSSRQPWINKTTKRIEDYFKEKKWEESE